MNQDVRWAHAREPRAGGDWAVVGLAALLLIAGLSSLRASPPQYQQDSTGKNQSPKIAKEERRRQKALQVEMTGPYWDWLHEEVPYIITEREREAFKQLTTDDNREMFIKNFWERRNPTPGGLENSYEQEYYQRIIFANERFGTGIPGWKTDRGRIYIMYGPPDRVDSQPDGDAAQGTSPYPFEYWHYSYIHGVGANVILNFVEH